MNLLQLDLAILLPHCRYETTLRKMVRWIENLSPDTPL